MSHHRWGFFKSGLPQHHQAANHLGLDFPFVLANFSSPPCPSLVTRQPHQFAESADRHHGLIPHVDLHQLVSFSIEQSASPWGLFRGGLGSPLVLLVHLARSVVVLLGSLFPITDPAPTMFSPVLGKAQRGTSNSPRLLSLTGWCFPPLVLVMTIRFRFVGHKREEVCIFMTSPSHVLRAGPSMGATPSAAVLKVVTRLSNDSRAGSRGRSRPNPGMGVGLPQRFKYSLILFLTVSKYWIMLSNTRCCCTSMLSNLAS